MLKISEKEDFEAREREIEAAVVVWKAAVAKVPAQIQVEFRSRLIISIIYHDAALEGRVLDHSEIMAAIDTSVISDSSLIPYYEDITNYNSAFTVAVELAKQPTPVAITVDLLRQLYGILNPNAKAESYQYREANPLHRLYYHTIVPPPDVPAAMKKFSSWLSSEKFLNLGAIAKAAALHHRLMTISPWLNQSGRLSRIVSMLILEQEGYPLAVLHSIDRQSYYEALKSGDSVALNRMYLEAVEVTAKSSLQVYAEAMSSGGGQQAS